MACKLHVLSNWKTEVRITVCNYSVITLHCTGVITRPTALCRTTPLCPYTRSRVVLGHPDMLAHHVRVQSAAAVLGVAAVEAGHRVLRVIARAAEVVGVAHRPQASVSPRYGNSWDPRKFGDRLQRL